MYFAYAIHSVGSDSVETHSVGSVLSNTPQGHTVQVRFQRRVANRVVSRVVHRELMDGILHKYPCDLPRLDPPAPLHLAVR